jgi:archaellum biogenesis ATPase FlaH
MRIVSFNDFIDLPSPNTQWLIEGLIPRPGVIEIMGPPKVGKSFLALDIAYCVARGDDFMNRPVVQSNVLYFQLDTSSRVMQDRGLELRRAGYNTVAPTLRVVHPDDSLKPLNIVSATGQSFLKAAITRTDPALVVIDTLREIHQEDENDSTAMKVVMDALENLCVGRSLLLVHHTNKLNPEITHPNPVIASRGSSYITGKVDAFWLVYDGRLQMTSRWDEVLEYPYKQLPSGMLSFPDTLSLSSLKPLVLKLRNDNPTLPRSELAKLASQQLRLSRATFYRVLSHCLNQLSNQ